MTGEPVVRLRARWKILAARAAELQAHAIFFLLYFLVFVPLALVRRLGRRPHSSDPQPSWTPRPKATDDLSTARRQY